MLAPSKQTHTEGAIDDLEEDVKATQLEEMTDQQKQVLIKSTWHNHLCSLILSCSFTCMCTYCLICHQGLGVYKSLIPQCHTTYTEIFARINFHHFCYPIPISYSWITVVEIYSTKYFDNVMVPWLDKILIFGYVHVHS